MDLSGLEKRTRSKNYTLDEQKMLFKIIEPHLPVLQSRTITATTPQKQAAWSEIARVFNAYNCMPRSIESLQGCYKNMKNKMKRDPELSDALIVAEGTIDKEAFLKALNPEVDWSEDETLPAEGMTPRHPADVISIGDFENGKNTFKPIRDGSEILKRRMEPLENGEPKRKKRSIDGVNIVSDVSKKKTELLNIGNRIEIKKKLMSNLDYGDTERKITGDVNIMRDVSERKRELVCLQQSIATEKLKEIQMSVALKELEIEHKRNIYKLELEQLNTMKQLSEQKLNMELMLLQLQMKQFENK